VGVVCMSREKERSLFEGGVVNLDRIDENIPTPNQTLTSGDNVGNSPVT